MAEWVTTADCNTIFRGPEGSEVGDLPVEIDGDVLRSFWKPTSAELQELKHGGYIILEILGQDHPPVRITTTSI